MQSPSDLRAFLLSVGIHVGVALLLWLGLVLRLPVPDEPAAGEPVQATLQLSKSDQRRVEKMIADARKDDVPTPAPKPPQPIAEKNPQDSDTPLQPTPQAPVDLPDPVDQEKVVAAAELASEQVRIQEEKRRQEQVELTEDVVRQEQAERRQRLREQQAQIQRELEAAQKRRKLEEQKLQQLADLRANAPKPAPTRAPEAPAGERGVDDSLRARYMAQIKAIAHQNWKQVGAPPLTPCRVRFRQIPGGIITKVEFIDCPYDEQGREFVDRALRADPMPYQGFEKVFDPNINLTFCYPEEECAK
jgi:colicin import membrane protein